MIIKIAHVHFFNLTKIIMYNYCKILEKREGLTPCRTNCVNLY